MELATAEAASYLECIPIIETGSDEDFVLKALESQWDQPAFEPVEQQADLSYWEPPEVVVIQAQSTDVAAEVPSNKRRIEGEIYGRSLGTIRKLGALMIEKPGIDIVNSPEAAQAKVEFFTSLTEGFGTDPELGGGLEVREFDKRPIIDGRVMAKDLKTAISDMTEAGVACAAETAKDDPRFLPQLTRSVWDHENALHVDRMVRGETEYNTILVMSPFPEEGAAASGDAFWRRVGYVPRYKRGFAQLYHFNGDDLITGSLSFDGSNKNKLRDIYGQIDVDIPVWEITDNWLKYPATRTLTEAQAKEFATNIANAADNPDLKKVTNTADVLEQFKPLMERVFAESYIHGCESVERGYQTDKARSMILHLADNAKHYNSRYSKALYRMRANPDQFTHDDMIVVHELLVYSTIEMMRALHLKETALQDGSMVKNPGDVNLSPSYLQTVDPALFQHMLGGFGADGARSGRVYSACGLEIGLGEEALRNDPQSPYGGMDKDLDHDVDSLGSRWFNCPKGHLNYRRFAGIREKYCRMCKVNVECKDEPRKFIEKPEKRAQLDKGWLAYMQLGAYWAGR